MTDALIHHSLVFDILKNPDFDDMRSNSRLNYHTRGLDYLCLHRLGDLTIKLYLVSPFAHRLDEDLNALVAPHTHAYPFQQVLLAGELTNLDIAKLGKSKPPHDVKFISRYRHTWDPVKRRSFPLADNEFNDPSYKHTLSLRERVIPLGCGYSMGLGEIHTIRTSDTMPTLLLSYQHESGDGPTLVYPPSIEGIWAETPIIPNHRQVVDLRDRCLAALEQGRAQLTR